MRDHSHNPPPSRSALDSSLYRQRMRAAGWRPATIYIREKYYQQMRELVRSGKVSSSSAALDLLLEKKEEP